jgi:hypothetical protein
MVLFYLPHGAPRMSPSRVSRGGGVGNHDRLEKNGYNE